MADETADRVISAARVLYEEERRKRKELIEALKMSRDLWGYNGAVRETFQGIIDRHSGDLYE